MTCQQVGSEKQSLTKLRQRKSESRFVVVGGNMVENWKTRDWSAVLIRKIELRSVVIQFEALGWGPVRRAEKDEKG